MAKSLFGARAERAAWRGLAWVAAVACVPLTLYCFLDHFHNLAALGVLGALVWLCEVEQPWN
jgi:hypothetical protein